MSLQSGLRSQRYSRAMHSLWLWQANSASVHSLETWGTAGVGEGQRGRQGRAGQKAWAAQALRGWEQALGPCVWLLGFWQTSVRQRSTRWTHHSIHGAWDMCWWPHPSLPETPHTVNKTHTCSHHITSHAGRKLAQGGRGGKAEGGERPKGWLVGSAQPSGPPPSFPSLQELIQVPGWA